MKVKVKVVETFHVDSETEVESLVNESKADHSFVLTGYKRKLKEIKKKGEVIDSYYIVELSKTFDE